MVVTRPWLEEGATLASVGKGELKLDWTPIDNPETIAKGLNPVAKTINVMGSVIEAAIYGEKVELTTVD